MAVQYGAVTITSTATLILPANTARRGCLVVNNGSVAVYFGFDASVTASTGMPLAASGGVLMDSGDNDSFRTAIWGITASSTSDVRYSEWTP